MPSIDEIAAIGGPPPKTAISKYNATRPLNVSTRADMKAPVTCVDLRVFPDQLLGLKVGETYIFRTVAGHPQPALQDLAALDIETGGSLEDVMIIYHTGQLTYSLKNNTPRLILLQQTAAPSVSRCLRFDRYGQRGIHHLKVMSNR